jgi:uncharacterized membrane protein
MYSKVKLFGHPVHPMLVAFPVAFYTATLVTFFVYAATIDIFWFKFATICNWVGVSTALLAAIPGFIDWAIGIPNGTPAKTHGLQHMVLNLFALGAFFISGVIQAAQWNAFAPASGWGIVLSLIGVAATLGAGYLGWTMVQSDHVGVDLTAEQERLERDNLARRQREAGRPHPQPRAPAE